MAGGAGKAAAEEATRQAAAEEAARQAAAEEAARKAAPVVADPLDAVNTKVEVAPLRHSSQGTRACETGAFADQTVVSMWT